MGQLDQFAKEMLAAETRSVTGGAADYVPPSELNLSEVRLDGMLRVLDASRLALLPAPWSLTGASDEIVLEVKMPGDHLDMTAVHRAELRRLARQVQRNENEKVTWDGDEALWITASHLPKSLAARRTLRLVAPGCYQVETGSFRFLWIAANELPLADELIPFLITRSGSALDAFGRWVKGRRAPEWLLRMVEFLPMSNAVYDELIRFATLKPVDQAMRARQQHAAKVLLEITPEVGEALVDKGLGPLVHQFERRLGRKLSTAERRTLQERLDRLGSERLGDVVLDLEPEQLAAWLRDADAR